MYRILLLLSILLSGSAVYAAQPSRGFTAEDLVVLERVSSLAVSPDGKSLAYVMRTTDMEANAAHREIWIMAVDGSGQRQLTNNAASSSSPVWAPDGRGLYFLSSRTGSTQVWRLELDGGEAKQVSELPLDVDNLKIAPDGSALVFSMEVFIDCPDIACTAERLKAGGKTSGKAYDSGFVRHWDTWKDGRRRHLFLAPLDAAELGEAADLMPGMNADAPTRPWGDAGELAFAPGGGVVFTARQGGADEPWSTNFELWYVAAPGKRPVNLTAANPAWDTQPVFSPDGKSLLWLAMSEPGYEADRFRIMRASWRNGKLGTAAEVAPDWDRSPGSLAMSSDGSSVLVHADHLGQRGLFAISPGDGAVRELLADGWVASEVEHGGQVFFTRSDLESPADIWALPLAGGGARQLSHFNRDKLAGISMGAAEQFSFTGANGDTVYAWMVKPANFEPGKSYPVALLIHGGPQGSFGNNFHYRWNPQTYAGAGYASIMVDFHGSTGYGKAFTDAIQDNWGGGPLEDLQQGLDAALKRYPWMDGDRVAALGASYGGYMINWIAGNWSDRFRALVNHDGLFDMAFMYYSTEEQWFPHREFKGAPHQNPDSYTRWNPVRHVAKWKTPMLVIHGELDYRVPITQGLATFTALQQQGVPSRLLYYPDENHWVLKPHNSVQWHREVLAWLEQWMK